MRVVYGLCVACDANRCGAADRCARPAEPLRPAGGAGGVTNGQVYTIPASEQAAGPAPVKIDGPVIEGAKPLNASIAVDPSKIISHISPMIYGACFEDLNHEVYGGLYAQMIFGESFEESPETGLPDGWSVWPDLNRRPMFTGMWTMQDGALWMTAYRDYSLVRDGLTFDDGVVSCDLLQDKYDPDRFVGISARVNPKNHRQGYHLRFSAGTKELSLWRNDKRLAGAAVSCGLNQWLSVKLQIEGGDLTVAIAGNDQPLLKASDPSPLPPGSISCDAEASRGMFKNLAVTSGKTNWTADFTTDHPHGTVSCWWDAILSGDGEFKWDADRPFNTERSQKITLKSATGRAGVANRGLGRWGLSLTHGKTYTSRLYLRGRAEGAVTVALQSVDGSATYATQSLSGVGDEWKRFDFSLTASQTDRNARFAVWIDRPGSIWLDQVVLMPTGDELFKGLPVRGDLGRMLVDSHVKAIRFGGDNSGALGFPWKNQIGDPDKRPQYNCPWYPFDSRGWGLVEFVAFCKAAGIEAIPCMSHRETAQDAADFVEFCNGAPDSKWGKVRVQMGYEQPLNLHWLQYGNGFTGPEKTAALADAVHKVDPSFNILAGSIGHMPSVLPKPQVLKQWGQLLDGKIVGYAMFPYVGGWGDGKQWEQMIVQNRASSGSIKVYCQEVNGGIHNLLRGLADAQFNSICEQHADDLAAVTYCGLVEADAFPDNGWEQGRIFFNSHQCWLQPAGWVGKMAAGAYLPLGVACDTTVPAITGEAYGQPRAHIQGVPLLSVTACRDPATSKLALKVVNIANVPIAADIALGGISAIPEMVNVAVLSGNNLKTFNTAEDPQRLHPIDQQIKIAPRFTYTFPAYSYTVFGPFPVSK